MFTKEKIDELNAARLSKVDPVLREKCEALIRLAASRGFTLLVTCGFRSKAEQDRLYAQGRTTPGKIVTKARGGQSKHNFGKAVDFAFIERGEVTWDVDRYYSRLGSWADVVGLKWGGNWRKFKDYPHVEL